jgi:hypothetical protein
VIVGLLCAILVPGLIGQLLTFVLVSIGLVGAVLLVFLEVGLSEDRERARQTARRARPDAKPHKPQARRQPTRIPRRPE